MRYAFVIALLLSGCYSAETKVSREPSAEKKAVEVKRPFQWCTCNFNACLGERKASCTSIIRCKKTTAADYANTVGNRRALLVLDDRRFCVNPMEGVMQGGIEMATPNQKVHGIIHVAAASAAAVGAGMAQLPGSDAPVLVAIQTAMIGAIAEVHDQRITKEKAFALLSTFAATVGGRTLSQWLVGWVPGWGNTVNATTAATLTETIGWAADAYFAKGESKKAA